MATNATTWFYSQPETGRPYFISERVNHTFWQNRISDVYFTCVNAESPYRLVGEWAEIDVELEFEPRKMFILRMAGESMPFVKGVSEILAFPPSVSYTDPDGRFVAEWYVDKKAAAERLQEAQGTPGFRNVKRYKR